MRRTPIGLLGDKKKAHEISADDAVILPAQRLDTLGSSLGISDTALTVWRFAKSAGSSRRSRS